MTSKERVLAVLRRETPDRVPFCPNIGQWFSHRTAHDMLPEDLRGCRDELDAMLRLGADIFSRRICAPVRSKRNGYDVEGESLGGGWHQTRYVTPVGTLSNRTKQEPASHTTYTHEHFVKDIDDLTTLRYIIEHTEYGYDEDAYAPVEARLGDAGVIMIPFFQSTIKLLHVWAGVEAASYLMIDHPDACHDLFDLYTEKVLAVARQAATSEARVFCTMDNLDSLSHSPALMREYGMPFYRALSEVFHASGKLLFSHACGQLWGLRELIAESGLDGLEASPHAPIGDLPVSEACRIHPDIIIAAGITAHETEDADEDARDHIFDYTRGLFADLPSSGHFLFGSACNTSIRTPWENIVHFRDACRQYGRL